jgi:hypothetical protein
MSRMICHILRVLRSLLGIAERTLSGKSFTVSHRGTNADKPRHPRSDRLFTFCASVDQLGRARIAGRERRRSLLRSRRLTRSVLRLLLPTFDLRIDSPGIANGSPFGGAIQI